MSLSSLSSVEVVEDVVVDYVVDVCEATERRLTCNGRDNTDGIARAGAGGTTTYVGGTTCGPMSSHLSSVDDVEDQVVNYIVDACETTERRLTCNNGKQMYHNGRAVVTRHAGVVPPMMTTPAETTTTSTIPRPIDGDVLDYTCEATERYVCGHGHGNGHDYSYYSCGHGGASMQQQEWMGIEAQHVPFADDETDKQELTKTKKKKNGFLGKLTRGVGRKRTSSHRSSGSQMSTETSVDAADVQLYFRP
jgi:hypothetical protein